MVVREAGDARKARVSLSLSPDVLTYLDDYVAAHPVGNRSRLVELAVREFRQRRLEEALAAQYDAPESADIERERADWRSIRRAASMRRADHD